MKAIFSLAGGLLVISGILHLVRVIAFFDPQRAIPAVLISLFGLAYLVIGVALLRGRDSAIRWGFILPLIGLVLTLLGMEPNPDFYTIAFIVLDVLVLALLGYVLLAGRGLLKRVR